MQTVFWRIQIFIEEMEKQLKRKKPKEQTVSSTQMKDLTFICNTIGAEVPTTPEDLEIFLLECFMVLEDINLLYGVFGYNVGDEIPEYTFKKFMNLKEAIERYTSGKQRPTDIPSDPENEL